MFLKKKSTSDTKNVAIETVVTPTVQKVKFYEVQDVINATHVVNEATEGNLIFLNINKISRYPEKRLSFLKALKLCADKQDTILKKVSDDTFMIAPNSLPIEVQALNGIKNLKE
ncbi:MAG: hypothetical protein ACTSYD_11980 [Candidatus Heimdallarchaeaceae archaeon]